MLTPEIRLGLEALRKNDANITFALTFALLKITAHQVGLVDEALYLDEVGDKVEAIYDKLMDLLDETKAQE